MKPPAWRQDRAVYPHSFHIQTRYRDEDGLHHINNIAVAAYYDDESKKALKGALSSAGRMASVPSGSRPWIGGTSTGAGR